MVNRAPNELDVDIDELDPLATPSSPGAHAVPNLVGEIIGKRYRVIEPLAEGGMSRVFRAEQADLKRTVAIKFLKTPALGNEREREVWRKRFEREAAAIASLSHPNVIVVHEYGTT